MFISLCNSFLFILVMVLIYWFHASSTVVLHYPLFKLTSCIYSTIQYISWSYMSYLNFLHVSSLYSFFLRSDHYLFIDYVVILRLLAVFNFMWLTSLLWFCMSSIVCCLTSLFSINASLVSIFSMIWSSLSLLVFAYYFPLVFNVQYLSINSAYILYSFKVSINFIYF